LHGAKNVEEGKKIKIGMELKKYWGKKRKKCPQKQVSVKEDRRKKKKKRMAIVAGVQKRVGERVRERGRSRLETRSFAQKEKM